MSHIPDCRYINASQQKLRCNEIQNTVLSNILCSSPKTAKPENFIKMSPYGGEMKFLLRQKWDFKSLCKLKADSGEIKFIIYLFPIFPIFFQYFSLVLFRVSRDFRHLHGIFPHYQLLCAILHPTRMAFPALFADFCPPFSCHFVPYYALYM